MSNSSMMRPTQLEVDISITRQNYRNIREYVNSGSEIIAVVKANAYGMGLTEIVRTLHEEGCKRFAVATPDEAYELRDDGYDGSVIVIGPSTLTAVPFYIEKNVETICADEDFLNALQEEAKKQKKNALVHYKIDTGLGRSGFSPERFAERAHLLYSMQSVRVCGILSHFAVADEGPSLFTETQFASFRRLLDELSDMKLEVGCRHICNSAATVQYPHMHLDAVRVGKLLHGFWPRVEGKPFESAYPFTLRSEITSVQRVEMGKSFGYGLRYVCRNDELIAVAPIGYADGYSRLYMGKTFALVRGRRVPVVGTIGCDQIFIKVTDIPGVTSGDEIVLIGAQGDERILPEELGEQIGTSACEVVSFLRQRVPRVYINK